MQSSRKEETIKKIFKNNLNSLCSITSTVMFNTIHFSL